MKKTSLPVDVRRSKTSLLKLPAEQRRRRRQRERYKSIRLRFPPKKQLCTFITFFGTFFLAVVARLRHGTS